MCIFQGNPISSMKLATGAEKGPASRRGTVVGAALLLCMAMAATGAQAADTERSGTGRDANSVQVQRFFSPEGAAAGGIAASGTGRGATPAGKPGLPAQ